MIDWLWPWIILFAPLPLAVRYLVPAAKSQQPALRAPFFREWAELHESRKPAGERSRPILVALWLVWFFFLAALARPIWIGDPVELAKSGRDLMLAVDISGSMRVEDMKLGQVTARRIDAVQQLGAEFIARRQGDRLGLILFGSNAYLQSPLSFDTATVRRFLLEARIGFAGQETAIGDAIGLSVKRLQERPADSRVLILLTDGRDTASSVKPLEAADLAASKGIRIYTIGIGAEEMTLPGLFGSSFGARQVNPSAELDEPMLRQIASITGGQYFRARNPRELASIYDLLDQLEPVEQESAVYRPRQALGYLPLLAALFLSFGLAFYKSARTGLLPSAPRTGAQGGGP